MNSTKWLWRSIGMGVLVSTLVCVVGFGYAVKEIMFPQPTAQEEAGAPAGVPGKSPQEEWAAKQQIRIVALGDSLTSGTGDLSGRGYVGQTKEKLQLQLGKPVFVYNNFAIPGFRTYDLLKDWDAKKDIDKALSEADLVLFTIGGNDLFEGGQDLFTNPQTGEGFNPQGAAQRMPEALKRLEQIVDRIAKAAPQAKIMYVGLYHPFLDLDPKREGSSVVQLWNTAAFEMANKYPNVTVVPTFDLFEMNLNKYLYTDHFHPNQEGYERIAERIADILK